MDWLSDVAHWFTDPANWQGPDGVPHLAVEHLTLSIAAVVLACLFALPVALWLGHTGRGGALSVTVSGVGRAVPTFAVLVLLSMAPSPFGLGRTSVLTALVLFAVPPVLTNAYVGIREVDPDAVDAARGMGMSGIQVLRQIEVPLAMPLILNGIRLAAVQVVATATIAALVAGGGLGVLIAQGFGRQDQPQLLAGAVCVAVLALTVELLLALAQRYADPMAAARRGPRPAPDAGGGRS